MIGRIFDDLKKYRKFLKIIYIFINTVNNNVKRIKKNAFFAQIKIKLNFLISFKIFLEKCIHLEIISIVKKVY